MPADYLDRASRSIGADTSERNISSDRHKNLRELQQDLALFEPFRQRERGPASDAILEAERALGFIRNTTEVVKDETPSLPKLEINFDDKLNYFAEHSLVIDKARRIGYDFEHNPSLAKAVWGGAVVTLGAAAVGLGVLKNPTAAAYLAATGSEALGFGAVGGMAGGSAMQWWYTSAQLRDQLPSSKLPEFKAVRMHGQ